MKAKSYRYEELRCVAWLIIWILAQRCQSTNKEDSAVGPPSSLSAKTTFGTKANLQQITRLYLINFKELTVTYCNLIVVSNHLVKPVE